MSEDVRSLTYGRLPPAGLSPRPGAFLDRDGVINVDRGYVHKASDIRWIPGVAAAIKRLNDWGYSVVVATNQAGIARGYYDEHAFRALSDWMIGELARTGAHIDAIYYCPHHPSEGIGALRRTCLCRKPAPGMLNAAIAAWHLDPSRCIFVGDKATDMQAAAAAGIRGLLFPADGDLDQFVRAQVGRAAAAP
ncbi:MAG: D-glycero-beta-D-manno-heptose 1,7-bisphosphate 7-phosphatase [Alphaproteobacteria bacterium]|nr:D-glycero-beta-D-manno-heptose 1,7-bisphosphate 7-phosphatase [Alphaproteobacteria bacterium]